LAAGTFTYSGDNRGDMGTEDGEVERQQREREPRTGFLEGIQVDVTSLHETWMELLFPRQRHAEHSVLGKWKPRTTGDKVKYRLWAALGVPIIAIGYPLFLIGVATRFYARRFDSVSTRIGLIGVVLLFVVLWGALTALARVRFDQAGFLAVASASTVAVVSAVLAYVFSRVGGRATTVLLAYPFAITAVFLPPVVAALYSPVLSDAIFPRSTTLARAILNTVFDFSIRGVKVNTWIRDNYELEGVAYALMWFGIAVPVGWVLGFLVTVADLARPKRDEDDERARST
jgi:hypothetical protein